MPSLAPRDIWPGSLSGHLLGEKEGENEAQSLKTTHEWACQNRREVCLGKSFNGENIWL